MLLTTSLDLPLGISMVETREKEVLLDAAKANLRPSQGMTVQTIPKRWRLRKDLQDFFSSELEIALIQINGVPHIEIRHLKSVVNLDE